MTKKMIISLALLATIILTLGQWVDDFGNDHVNQSLKRTLATYAVTRGMNGVISIIQGTELAISPAGLGITLTLGQVLSPIKDLIDQFSHILLLSSAALGIQKLLLKLSSSLLVAWTLAGLLFFLLIKLWSHRSNPFKIPKWVSKLLVLFLVLRFVVPVSAVIMIGLDYLYFEQEELESTQGLGTFESEINKLRPQQPTSQEEQSLSDKIKSIWTNSIDGLSIGSKISTLESKADQITKYLINLIVLFLIKYIALPLGLLYLLIKVPWWIMEQDFFTTKKEVFRYKEPLEEEK